MSAVCMQCVFEINGETRVAGNLYFRQNDGVELVFQVSTGLPRGPIMLKIGSCDCVDLAAFFAQDEMYFWKVPVFVPESPYQDVMCIVSFSKDDHGIAIHLSLDFETEKMHMETPIDEETLAHMPSVWGIDSEPKN